MSKGYVETSVIKCLIIGAAGVGKTHLKHLLLKKDPPKQRVSTGLADNPVRALQRSLVGVGGPTNDDWFVVEDDNKLMDITANEIKGDVSMTKSMADVVRILPNMVPNSSDPPNDEVGIGHPTPAEVSGTSDSTVQSEAVALEYDMIRQISQASTGNCMFDISDLICKIAKYMYAGKKKLLGAKWIQLIDSGGQCQYHDIFPLFIGESSVIIFVLKLSDELSSQTTTECYGTDGNPIGKSYQSSFSHKQILQNCLQIHQDKDAHIMIVGTHQDLEHQCKETRTEKNKTLKSLMKSTISDRVIYPDESFKEMIFAVNCKDPKESDKTVGMRLRKTIISYSQVKMAKLPLAWFGLEIVLRRLLGHHGILSVEDCKGCAKQLCIEGEAFSAALHHLVHYNLFLYYPEVLPQVVFCDPQVILTKLTELVLYHQKLRDNPSYGDVCIKGKWTRFRDQALLSEEFLLNFPEYYENGLFTPQDFLLLLVDRHAAAKISKEEYLMPALLLHLEPNQEFRCCKPSGHSASLMITFSCGCAPSGLFCCLVAHLLSPKTQSPWKVCMEEDHPLCLYRNCISFEQVNAPGVVTLFDRFFHFEVCVDKASSEICSEIRRCLHSAIKMACVVLKYPEVRLKDAFSCPGSDCTEDSPHVAVVTYSEVLLAYMWKCSSRARQTGSLSESQLMWLPPVTCEGLSKSCRSWTDGELIALSSRCTS